MLLRSSEIKPLFSDFTFYPEPTSGVPKRLCLFPSFSNLTATSGVPKPLNRLNWQLRTCCNRARMVSFYLQEWFLTRSVSSDHVLSRSRRNATSTSWVPILALGRGGGGGCHENSTFTNLSRTSLPMLAGGCLFTSYDVFRPVQ